MISLDQKTPKELAIEVAARVRSRRKERKLTQQQLATKAGMSLGSYKRFEHTGEISFVSLAAIAIALDCEQGLEELFSHRQYSSIEEVLDEQRK